jgi:hypothetical protein
MNQPIIIMYEGKPYTIAELLRLEEGEKLLAEWGQNCPYEFEAKYSNINQSMWIERLSQIKPTITMSDQELRLEILKIVLAFNAEQGEKGSILSVAKQTNYIYNYIKTGKLPNAE